MYGETFVCLHSCYTVRGGPIVLTGLLCGHWRPWTPIGKAGFCLSLVCLFLALGKAFDCHGRAFSRYGCCLYSIAIEHCFNCNWNNFYLQLKMISIAIEENSQRRWGRRPMRKKEQQPATEDWTVKWVERCCPYPYILLHFPTFSNTKWPKSVYKRVQPCIEITVIHGSSNRKSCGCGNSCTSV